MLLVAGAALALVALTAGGDGLDGEAVGVITVRDAHQVCVAPVDGAVACAHVDSPQRLVGFATGDCARIRYSPESLLASIDHGDDCVRR